MILDNTGKSLIDPDTHKDIVKSVTSIVDVFIEVANKRTLTNSFEQPAMETEASDSIKELSLFSLQIHSDYFEDKNVLPIPSISNLMSLFGDWLLAQASIKGRHELGQAEAIACLCKIFHTTAGPVSDNYLGKFYKAVFKGFKFANENNSQVAGSILANTVKLLIQDHRGIRVLLHKSCVFRVLGVYLISKDISFSIKKSCYSILATIITIMKPYKLHGIVSTINEALTSAIALENDSENLMLLFWTICGYISIIDDPAINEKLIKSMVNKILLLDNADKVLYCECLNVISVIPFMIENQNLISDQIVKELVNKFITSILRKSTRSLSDSLYISSLNMLTH